MSGLVCGCGHAVSDHSRKETGACMVIVTDEGHFCSCISVWVEIDTEAES